MSLCFYVFGNAPLRAPAWGHAEKGPKICLQKGPIILYEIIIETQQLNAEPCCMLLVLCTSEVEGIGQQPPIL